MKPKAVKSPYAKVDLDELLRALRAVEALVVRPSTWRSLSERSALTIELRKAAAGCARLHEAMAPGRPVRNNPYRRKTGAQAQAWYAGHAVGYALGTFDVLDRGVLVDGGAL